MPFVPLPRIGESAAALQTLHRAERDPRRRERLHALWLLAGGALKSRAALARRLGRHVQSVSRWLEDDAQGGLSALLRPAKVPGPPNRGGIGLPKEAQEAVRARLVKPQGERGYLALWQWAKAEHGMTYSYSHFQRWARGQMGAKLKVARKSHGGKKRGGTCRLPRRGFEGATSGRASRPSHKAPLPLEPG